MRNAVVTVMVARVACPHCGTLIPDFRHPKWHGFHAWWRCTRTPPKTARCPHCSRWVNIPRWLRGGLAGPFTAETGEREQDDA